MKLLLDENLSPRLAERLAETYPATAHVRDFGLESAPDSTVWAHAANRGYAIATKDADFHHRSLLRGHPSKVIWIRVGVVGQFEKARHGFTRDAILSK